MKAHTIKKAWDCPECGPTVTPPEKVEVWPIDLGQFFDEAHSALLVSPKDLARILEPETLLECAGCEQRWSAEEMPRRDEPVFVCDVCDEIFEDRDEAMECCRD